MVLHWSSVPRHDQLYLADIIHTAWEIEELLQGYVQQTFLEDLRTRKAIAQSLMVIGEPVACLSQELKDRHPGVAWHEAKGLRNVLAHHYWGTDWLAIWKTAMVDVPVLSRQIAGIQEQEFP